MSPSDFSGPAFFLALRIVKSFGASLDVPAVFERLRAIAEGGYSLSDLDMAEAQASPSAELSALESGLALSVTYEELHERMTAGRVLQFMRHEGLG